MPVESIEERIRRAGVLVEALPYIKRFFGHTVVIKLGGAAIESGNPEPVLQDVVLLRFVGMRPVLVHGGGPAISAWQKKVGIETRFVNGLRVTDAQTMELAKMVLTGKIGPELVSTINRLGGEAFGMSGEDGPSLLVKPRAAEGGEDLGYDGQAYNVNADSVAAELAVALRATKLMLLTDVDGVRDADGTLISELDAERAQRLIAAGVIAGGMIPKVMAALRALDGTEAVHIIDGRVAHSVLLELLTESGVGTMLRRPALEAQPA